MANIPHYLRLKPKGDSPEDTTKECLIETQSDTQIKFKTTSSPNKFTQIFNDVSQVDLYSSTLQDLTKELFEEKDSVLFTLGPSNSGKSYSIYGNDSNPGIAIYSLNELINKISDNMIDYKILKRHFGESFLVSSRAKSHSGEFGLSLSVFEIYNDRIRDLSLDTSKTVNQSLDIITDVKDGKIKPNKIRQIYVSSLDEAKLVLHKSIKRRAVSSTNINLQSSRSHLFIYFNLHKLIRGVVKTSRLTIADLAGSERTKSAKTEGKEFKEGNYTNQSLTELGRCLSLMKSKKFDRSILRTSKLTRLLLTDLFGNISQNRMKILLTLDPYSHISNIVHAIRYIQPVAKVTIHSERNSMDVSEVDSIQLTQLTEEIKLLKGLNEMLGKERDDLRKELVQTEVNVRREVCDEYEVKINELDLIHSKAINGLKEVNQESLDEKLSELSKDYERSIEELKKASDDKIARILKENDLKIDALDQEHINKCELLIQDYERQIDDLTKTQNKDSNLLSEDLIGLRKELDELKQVKTKTEQDLISDITKEKRINDELQNKLSKLSKDFDSLESENTRKTQEIVSLTERLVEATNKRKSDVIMTGIDKKPKLSLTSTEDNQGIENESLSPIIIAQSYKSSPSKHFKFNSSGNAIAIKSPKKLLNSPTKKASFERSPSKVLKVVNLDYTLPSPKLKARSPSPSPSRKRKLLKKPIVDDSFE